MKTAAMFLAPLFVLCGLLPQIVPAATRPDIDPCTLIALKVVSAAFPTLQTMKKQTIGPNTTCNYLNRSGLSGLIVSVHRDDGISAHTMMENLGKGYRAVDVPGLGDEAAMAVTLPEPKYNIPGGLVAELYIKKGGSALLLAPARIEVKAGDESLGLLQELAARMLGRL